MVSNRERVINNIEVLKDNIVHHFVYTLSLIIISSIISCFFVYLLMTHKEVHIAKPVYQKNTSTATNDNDSDGGDYTERGSPYDNRTVGSESATVIFHGPRNKKEIALTFDAEMTDRMKANYLSGRVKSSYDKTIIDTLDTTQTQATLFLTGMWIELYPDVTQQLSNDPLFELGSHSYADSSFNGYCYGLHQLSVPLKIEDVGVTEKLLRERAHIDNQLFRFPGGCYTPSDVALVNQAGDIVVHWDVAAADGFNQNTNQIVHNVIDNVQNGSIIILHMNGAPTAPHTADALPIIINTLKQRGFTFVKVSELLGLPPEQKIP